MMNDNLAQSDIPTLTVFHFLRCSDYFSSITIVGVQTSVGRRDFMFYDMLRDHDQYTEIVRGGDRHGYMAQHSFSSVRG